MRTRVLKKKERERKLVMLGWRTLAGSKKKERLAVSMQITSTLSA